MCFVGLLTRLTLCGYVLSFAIVMLLCYSRCIFYHVTSFVRLRLGVILGRVYNMLPHDLH